MQYFFYNLLVKLRFRMDARRLNVVRAKSVIEKAYDPFIAMDIHGAITDWNHQAEVTFGWLRCEVVGRPLAQILIPARHQRAHNIGLQHYLKTGEGPMLNKRLEVGAMHKDGREIPVELTISPVHVGRVAIFSAFLRDITAQKRALQMQAVQLEATRIMAEADSVPEAAGRLLAAIGQGLGWAFAGLWVVDDRVQDLRLFEHWRDGADSLSAFVRRSRDMNLVRGIDLPGRVWSTAAAAWIDDVAVESRFPRATAAGEAGLHGAAAFPIMNGGKIVAVVEFFSRQCCVEDKALLDLMADLGSRFGMFIQRKTAIDQLKRAEEDLRKLNQVLEDRVTERTAEAEAANKAKSAFLANMSHEIRTPLGVVLGFSEVLASQPLSMDERRSYADAIKRNGDLLSNIIGDILDLSKVEAGKLQIDRCEVPLAEVLTDIETMLRLQAQEKGLQLVVHLDPAAPPRLVTDALRLRQILINIIGNAVKFTQRGAVSVTVAPVTTSGGRVLLSFEVRDSGAGITPEQAQKLFTPFTQADASTKRQFGGTGLGLVLARRLAHQLGGDVELKSSAFGVGSTFVITIDPGTVPAVAASDPTPGARALSPQALPTRLDGVKILLVDDAPDNQLLVGRYLKIAGAIVETAENGLIAIAKVETAAYDIVLMDLQMPVMDGYEATAKLRQAGYQKPIVALTAHAFKEERQRCLDSGFDEHISKPVDRHDLLACLCGVLAADPAGAAAS